MTNPVDRPRPPTKRPQARCEATRQRILNRLSHHVATSGRYQLSLKEILSASGASHASLISRYFGGIRLVLSCVARHDPKSVVDSLGLSEQAYAALTERDVKTLATAVLAGRRAEHP